jgi:transcriptional regulator
VFLSGVSALAVPIFNHESRVVAALTALGRESSFNVDWNGAAALVLRRTADMISRQLGYVDHGQALGSAPAHQGPPRRARGAAG